ncbi:hypothetical protein P7K49_000473 [Saguinus oedipus]|uniref:Uncharacterized protein n=1 Tax=Saguinus oedipus TaxID=9490 RepID=A0ABQ9WBS1_SAGOE|nr:hypothetical protein P7K49_000473 [Saguinus oedipus]
MGGVYLPDLYPQLLGELILDRHNFAIMTKYISKPENLKLMMNLLRDKSPNIQFEAFHVFKLIVALRADGCNSYSLENKKFYPQLIPEYKSQLQSSAKKVRFHWDEVYIDCSGNLTIGPVISPSMPYMERAELAAVLCCSHWQKHPAQPGRHTLHTQPSVTILNSAPVFVASPHKTQPIVDILLKNQPKLIEFLSSFQKERTDDEQFTDEKNYLIKQIRDLKKTAP